MQCASPPLPEHLYPENKLAHELLFHKNNKCVQHGQSSWDNPYFMQHCIYNNLGHNKNNTSCMLDVCLNTGGYTSCV